MQTLTARELESQMVLELPDRELMGGLIHISGLSIDVSVLENLLNHSFNHWTVNILDKNDVDVTVTDVVSQNDLDVFCNQVVAVLSAQCKAELI
jgi:hypothetical protein